MKIGIDATNIKSGGGLAHLKQVLENYSTNTNIINVIGGNWLDEIENRKWLNKISLNRFFSNFLKQELFKRTKLPSLLNYNDVIFVPGGTFSTKKTPYVSMSQNMLVFEKNERNRFSKSFTWLRYVLLEKLQVKSFKNSKGIIYISNYAKDYIQNKHPKLKKIKSTVIYHGISDEFRKKPKKQYDITDYSEVTPFRLLYISIINFYKHQWNVIEAVKRLKEENFNIELDLIGPIHEPARKRFEISLKGTDKYIHYHGKVAYNKISNAYKKADLFIFASTCENMPNILLEAMSAGLPILSSNYGPMPEVLKESGDYMDPTDINSIYLELKKLLLNPQRRKEIAEKAHLSSKKFSWTNTADETFKFIEEIYNQNKES